MIYFVIFGFLFVISLITKAKLPSEINIFVFIILNVLLIGLAGLRGNVDPDYENYLDVFQSSGVKYSISAQIEPGYYYLNQYIYLSGLPFQLVLLVTAFASVYFKIIFFKKFSPNYGLSVLVYFCTVFFLFDFISIRQAVALAVFMISIPFIYEKKFWPYCLLLLIASQIHVSALVLIPGYFLFNRHFTKRTLITVVIICAIINALQIRVPLIDMVLKFLPIPGGSADKITIYLQSDEYSLVSLKQLALCILFIHVKYEGNTSDRMLNILVNLFVFGVLLATLFNGLPQLSYRIKWYFFWTESVLIVYVVEYLAGKNLKLMFLIYAFLLLLYGYTLITFLNEIASRGNYIFPYKFFFE